MMGHAVPVRSFYVLRFTFYVMMNWAIREIGQRSAELNAAAIATSQRLQASNSRTARWVGSDALRELTSAKIAQRVAGRWGNQKAES
jgi:hypothetical protein